MNKTKEVASIPLAAPNKEAPHLFNVETASILTERETASLTTQKTAYPKKLKTTKDKKSQNSSGIVGGPGIR